MAARKTFHFFRSFSSNCRIHSPNKCFKITLTIISIAITNRSYWNLCIHQCVLMLFCHPQNVSRTIKKRNFLCNIKKTASTFFLNEILPNKSSGKCIKSVVFCCCYIFRKTYFLFDIFGEYEKTSIEHWQGFYLLLVFIFNIHSYGIIIL